MTVGQQGSLESVFSLNVENLSNKETKDSSLMTIFGIATITGALESNTWSDIIYDEILGESYLVEILDEIIPQVDKTLKIVDDAADAKATGDAVKSVIYIGEQEPDNEYTQLWIKRNGENTEESIPTITLDKTLTVEDTAADAKAVGDRLAPLEEALSNWFNIARLKIYNEEDSSILEESYPDLNSELKLF